DGRPMVVFYFADADPAGWQMGVSVARKLQAFKTLEFGDLTFEVRRVALTPDQVREYGKPSTSPVRLKVGTSISGRSKSLASTRRAWFNSSISVRMASSLAS